MVRFLGKDYTRAALKMGKKYEKRYWKHFKNPDIRRYDLEHEELLMCYPEKWIEEVKSVLHTDKYQDI